MAREFTDFNVEELQGYYSDFHKDFYGFRPRNASIKEWNSKEYLVAEINRIHDRMDNMKSTAQGRAYLREQGWIFDDPVV